MRKTAAFALFLIIAVSLFTGVTAANAAGYILYDVNADGYISAADARITLRASVLLVKLSDEQKKAADIDSDGSVTAFDARSILRRAVGYTDYFNDFISSVNSPQVLNFGSDSAEISAVMGEYDNVCYEIVSGKQITSYLYYSDYTDFTVLQFLNNRLTGIMTFNKETVLSCGTIKTDIANASDTVVQNSLKNAGYYVSLFTESFNKDEPYAVYISNQNNYTYAKMKEITAQELLGFHFTNALRAMNNIPVVESSVSAACAARLHSSDMAANSFFSHVSSNGKELRERLAAQNIKYTYAGENICRNYENVFDGTDALYNSQKHRDTILETRLKYVGIGCARSANGFGYITQDFYTPVNA